MLLLYRCQSDITISTFGLTTWAKWLVIDGIKVRLRETRYETTITIYLVNK